MPNLPEHPFDSVAREISDWVNNEAKWYADALVEGYRAPFSAKVSESDKLAYYRRLMYQQNPDGSVDFTKPNTQGRDALLKRVGTQNYVTIARAVGPKRGEQYIQDVSMEMPEEADGGDNQS